MENIKQPTQDEIRLAWKAIHTIFDANNDMVSYSIPISTPPTIKHYTKLMHLMDVCLDDIQKDVLIERLFKGKSYKEIGCIIGSTRETSSKANNIYRRAIDCIRLNDAIPGMMNHEYLIDDNVD